MTVLLIAVTHYYNKALASDLENDRSLLYWGSVAIHFSICHFSRAEEVGLLN